MQTWRPGQAWAGEHLLAGYAPTGHFFCNLPGLRVQLPRYMFTVRLIPLSIAPVTVRGAAKGRRLRSVYRLKLTQRMTSVMFLLVVLKE